jgi:hypothetical protein
MESQFYTNKERSTGLLGCSCHGDDHYVIFNVDLDELDTDCSYFITVNLGPTHGWRERLKYWWHVICHNESYVSEVLSLETVKDFHKWLGEKIAVAESKTK